VDQFPLRRYTAVLAFCTFLLVIAGGLVTSNDAALATPDWPLSWGRLVPVLEGGIRYEFAHRIAAVAVALLTAVLAIRLRTRLAWIALGTIAAQIALGGALVRFLDPKAAAVAHAALAQFFFGLIIVLWMGGRRTAPLPLAPTLAAVAIFGQTVLGAAVRHGVIGPMPHVAGAIVATVLVMWAGLSILGSQMDNAALRRPAMLLLSLTFSQVFLGIGAWMSRLAYLNAPQPMPLMVLFTVAHVAVGALTLGAAIALAMTAPSGASMRQEGMAAA